MLSEEKYRILLKALGKLFVLTIAAFLSAISVSAFVFVRSMDSIMTYSEQPWPALLRDAVHAEPILFITVIIVCLYWFLAAKIKRISGSGIVVGLLLALNMVFSLSMEHSELTEVFLPAGLWGNLILTAGFACMCTAAAETIFMLCDRKKKTGLLKVSRIKSTGLFFLAFFVLIVCWLPGMLYCYPGSVMADTVNQIRSIAGLERITASNPILSTLVFGYLYQFGLSVNNEGLGLFLSVVVQVLLNGAAMALAATAAYRYTKSKGWYIAILLFFGVLPVWQNAVQLIMKDVFHTACFLLFCIQYLKCIRKPKKSLSNVILLGVCFLLITYTRRATFYLGVICVAVTAIMHWKKYFLPYVICLVVVVGFFQFCNHVLYPRLNIQPEWESENYSMQFQQVALYCRTYQDEMTAEEKETINRTLDFDTIVAEYTPMISDAVKITYHGSDTDHQAFWQLYWRMWGTHPLTMIKSVVMGTFEHMNPWFDNPMLRVYISDVGDYLHASFTHKNVYDIYNYWIGWLKVPVIRLFIGTGLYMWLTLIMIGYAIRKGSLRAFLGQLPAVILFAGLFMSHVNGEIRYGYPLIAATPLFFSWVLYSTSPKNRKRSLAAPAEKASASVLLDQALPKNETEKNNMRSVSVQESVKTIQADEALLPPQVLAQRAPSPVPAQAAPPSPADTPEQQKKDEGSTLSDMLIHIIKKGIPVPKRPLTYLDALKLIAIYFVLFNHTGSRGFSYFAYHMDAPWHMITLVLSVIDKVAVPLFFMASGALLIGREESYGKLFIHRVLRNALILLAASFVNYMVYVKGAGLFDPLDFIRRFYTNDIVFPLWYMYCYLSFLMMLPFIRKLGRGMKDKDYIWLLASHLIMQAISVVDYLAFKGSAYHTQYLFFFTSYSYVVYSLCGYYIEKRLRDDRLNGDILFILIICSVAAIGLTYILTEWRCKMLNDWSDSNAQAFMNSFIVVPSVTLFYAMKLLFQKHPVSDRAARFLSILSSCTFGVYLFEKTWRNAGDGVYSALAGSIGDFPASIVHILFSCAVGLAVTMVWKVCVGLVTNRIKQAKED